MADDVVSYTWHEIIAWGVFFLIIGAVGITAWYFLKDTPIGQTFGDLFGAVNAVLAAIDNQITTCLKVGLFGTGCTLGFWGLGALGVFVVFGIGKWLFGPATETRFGRLWKAAKGRDVTNEDIKDMNGKIDSAIAESREANPDKWKNIPEGSEREVLVRRLVATSVTGKSIQTDINNNPEVQNKTALTNDNNAEQTVQREAVQKDAVDNGYDDDEIDDAAADVDPRIV